MTELPSIKSRRAQSVWILRAAVRADVCRGIWADNEHTAVGTLLHDHADAPGYETDVGVTILRAVPLFSERYGLSGKADIVEVTVMAPAFAK